MENICSIAGVNEGVRNTVLSRDTTKAEDGFTLVELLVVMLIIGVLSAIAVPLFLNQRKSANDAAVESDLKNIATAIQSFPGNAKKFTKVSVGSSEGIEMAKMSYFSDNALQYAEIPTTAGVVWTVAGDSYQYCIVGYHTNGKKHIRSSPLVYDSAAGGMGRSGDGCNPADILGEDGQIMTTGNLVDDPLFANLNKPTAFGSVTNRVSSYWSAPWSTVNVSNPVGNKSIEVTTNSTIYGQGIIFFQPVNGNAVPIAKAGEKWTVSMYIKAPKDKVIHLGLRLVDVDGSNGSNLGEYKKAITASGGWERISYTYTTSSTESGYYPAVQFNDDDKIPGQKILVAGPMVERNATMSPFSAK